ncbi:MAG: FGGY family carbohydrate kinase [Candidatus Atribacteria bacterium]|nr:FGGY family carbohydrate kinase [Candidatus Atribacteria bacterium]
MALAGLDVGTSGCKVMVFRNDGTIIAQSYREYPFITPQPGWLEMNPENIWQSVLVSLQEVVQKSSEAIEVMAVTSHGETLIPIDKNGRALWNAIANFDTRAHPYINFWKEKADPLTFFQITGMPLHGMYTVNKILWLKEHCPEVFEKTWKFCCVEDFIIHRLTGEDPVIDYSLASRTMLFDVIRKEWSPLITGYAGVEIDRLSRVSPSGVVAGEIKESVSRETGLPSRLSVATGGHDQPCGVLGCGVKKPGEAMYGIGTSECVALNLGEKPFLTRGMMENSFCCSPHVEQDSYLTLAYIASGAAVLRWFRDEFGFEEKQQSQLSGKNIYDLLLEKMPDKPASIFVLPHFSGSGTPYLDEKSRGAFIGLTLATSKGESVRAILESLTYEMKISLDLYEAFGLPIHSLRAIGGGSRSEPWLQIKADILQKPLTIPLAGETVALGTAMLAGMAKGIFATVDEAIDAMVVFQKTIVPRPDFQKMYEPRYQIYQKIYRNLREINAMISDLTPEEE